MRVYDELNRTLPQPMIQNLKLITACFYSLHPYRHAAHNWKGFAVLYLFVLSLICAISCHLKWHLLFTEIGHGARELSHSVPGVSIRNGRFLVKSESPFVFARDSRKRPLLIVDTKNHSNAPLGRGAPLVVGAQDIRFYGFSDKDTNSVPKINIPLNDLLANLNMDLDPTEIANFIEKVCFWLSVVFFSGILVMVFATSVIQSFFWGFVGHCCNRQWIKGKHKYQALVRVAALALTPSLVIRGLTGFFGIDLPFVLDVLVIVIYFGYLIFAYTALYKKPADLPPPALAEEMA